MIETVEKKSSSKIWSFFKWTGITLTGIALLLSLVVYLLRDKVVHIVVTELNKTLTVPVQVADIDLRFWSSFPNLSVDFDEVLIRESNPSTQTPDTLLYTERIRLKFNPIQILKKNYSVQEIQLYPGIAKVRMFADRSVNYDILKKDSVATNSNFSFNLAAVRMDNFRVRYTHEPSEQHYQLMVEDAQLSGDFNQKTTSLALEIQAAVEKASVEGVPLIAQSSLQSTLQVLVNSHLGTVDIPNAQVRISELPFLLDLHAKEGGLDFTLTSNKVQLTDIAKCIQHASTQKIKELKGSGQLNFHLQFSQKQSTSPTILAQFNLQNGRLVEPLTNLPLNQLYLKGLFAKNHPRYEDQLHIEDLRFRTSTGPFGGNMKMTHFSKPQIVGSAHGIINLDVLHTLFPIPTLATASGNVALNGDFQVNKSEQGWDLTQCMADCELREVKLQQVEDKRLYDHINGHVVINQERADIDHFRLTVNQSDVSAKGSLESINHYLKKTGKLQVNMQLTSAFLDVQDLSSTEKSEEIANGRNFILPSDISGQIRLLCNQLKYEQHSFRQLSSNVEIGSRLLNFNDLELTNSAARIEGKVSISEKSPEVFTIQTAAHTDRLSFQPLFKEWNNFDQNVISSEQIQGFAKVNLNLTAPFDLRTGIKKNDIVAKIKLVVEDGKLSNVQAFKAITQSLRSSKMVHLALKQRNIETLEKNLLNLSFDRLENEFEIKNSQIILPKMLISNNALDVNLVGTHGFDNQVDYRFDFRFRELKSQDRRTEFGEVVDDGTGVRLFVHLFGPLDDPTIEWDKSAQKQLVKENFEQEKQTAKSILKSELGLYKKDTTVAVYVAPKENKVRVEVTSSLDTPEAEVSPKPEGKVQKTFSKWKEEAEKKKKSSTTLEGF